MTDNNLDKLKEIFKIEVDELIDSAEDVLIAIEKDKENEDLMNEIFRVFHSIKGSAGVVGFEDMGHFAHGVENVLDRVRNKEVNITKGLISLILDSVDSIKNYVQYYFEGTNLDKAKIEKINSSLNRFMGVNQEAVPVLNKTKKKKQDKKINYFGIHIEMSEDIFYKGQDPLLLLQELSELGDFETIRSNISKIPLLDKIDSFTSYIYYDIVLKTEKNKDEIDDVFMFVIDDNKIGISDISSRFVDGIDTELADKRIGELLVDEGIIEEEEVEEIVAEHKKIGEEIVEKKNVSQKEVEKLITKKKKSQKVQIASSIRVRTDKLDKLINLIGEMVIGVAKVSLSAKESENKNIIQSAIELSNISRDLQEQIMMVRMVPLESTFKRFHRVVRDLANSQSKNIELHISGEDTELDKTMIEQITDPLKHMIRNSADHGVETSDIRVKNGKPEKGNIWLRAFQEEGNIIIEIEDDGAGIDPDIIYNKAKEKALVKNSKKSYTDEEIFSFLFLPGFSTAAKVTEISGRGVGMDVVKKNIESLKGRIEISSVKGEGSKFKIRIPLTIAIIDGMQIRIGKKTYVLPLDQIVETFKFSTLELKSIKGESDLVNLRGEVFPLIKLHPYFKENLEKVDKEKGIVILVESTYKKFCIYVDEILGINQAVIKNLQKNYQPIPGIVGASLNGDGTISLIIDIPGIEKVMGI